MLPRFFEASIFTWVMLIACVGGLAWLVLRIRSWFREDEDPKAHAEEMLLQFGDLRREGHLSEEEYRSIKGQLVRPKSAPSVQERHSDRPVEDEEKENTASDR
jgi:hypothetical protein